MTYPPQVVLSLRDGGKVIDLEEEQVPPPPPEGPRVFRWIGDSKTAQSNSWRVQLWPILVANDIDFEYVGAFQNADNPPCEDPDHDGVNGQRISQIRARAVVYTGPSVTDVVVMAGRNDAMAGDAATTIRDSMSLLIDDIKTTHPLAQIIVLPDAVIGEFEVANIYNGLLPALCATKGVLVHFIDTYAAGPYQMIPNFGGGDVLDGAGHVSLQGNLKIAHQLAVFYGYTF